LQGVSIPHTHPAGLFTFGAIFGEPYFRLLAVNVKVREIDRYHFADSQASTITKGQ
jgi:hypothetical protein